MKKLFLLLILQLPVISFANEVWMRYPSISPDGKHIAFSYQGDLFLVDVNGIPLEIIITDTSGKVIEIEMESDQLDLSNQPAGIYLVQINKYYFKVTKL